MARYQKHPTASFADKQRHGVRLVLRILIFGGCVSRDAITFGNLESSLSGYFARSSFGTFAGMPALQPDILAAIPSNFQRRCVQADMEKSFLKRVAQADFDVLLIDLISQRYSLLRLEKGGLLTLSNEYVSANRDFASCGRVIKRGSPEHLDLWRRGAEIVADAFKASGIIDRVRISKLYWDENFDTEQSDRIAFENSYLAERYADLERLLPDRCFIEYAPDLFTSDPEHKWKAAAYHYTRPLYDETIRQLMAPKKERRMPRSTEAGRMTYGNNLSHRLNLTFSAPVIHDKGTSFPKKLPFVHGCGVLNSTLITQGDSPVLPAGNIETLGMSLRGAVSIYTDKAIITDPLGAGCVFIWESGKQWAVSSDLGALLVHLQAIGVQARKSGLYSAMYLTFGNGAYGRTSFSDIRILAPHRYIEFRKNALSSRWSFVEREYPVVQYLTKSVRYEDAVDEAVEDIKANVRAAAAFDGKILSHVTGGFDSRMVFAALLSEGVEFTGFCSGRYGTPDVDTAFPLCARYGIPMSRQQPFRSTLVPATMKDAFLREMRNFHGMKADALPDEGDASTLVLGGAYGELYRQFFRPGVDPTSVGGALLAPSTKSEIEEIGRTEMARLGHDPEIANQFHYIRNRTRYHFGLSTRATSEITPRFDPLYSLPGFRAAFAAGLERRTSGMVLFDIMEKLHHELPHIAFGTGKWHDSVQPRVKPIELQKRSPVLLDAEVPSSPRWANYPPTTEAHIAETARTNSQLWAVVNFEEAQKLLRDALRGQNMDAIFEQKQIERLASAKPRGRADYNRIYRILGIALWMQSNA